LDSRGIRSPVDGSRLPRLSVTCIFSHYVTFNPPLVSMDLQLGIVLGLLAGAAKVLGIAAVGFGIAWWRSRKRVRELEAKQHEVPELQERLDRIERSIEYMASQFERLADPASARALPRGRQAREDGEDS
jgi:hypothetical protein